MDNVQILRFIGKCPKLRHKCVGVFSADNFPVLPPNTFQIVNASKQRQIGSHWLLFCRRRGEKHVIFADPLGFPIEIYTDVYTRTGMFYHNVIDYMAEHPIQPLNSDKCGMYCIYLAHVIFSNNYPVLPMIHEMELSEFAKHME